MFLLLAAFSLVAFAQAAAASLVPVKSSQVDVRQSGAEFSYNIQENHGVATIGDSLHVLQPLVKAVHLEEKPVAIAISKEKHVEQHQGQLHHEQRVEARSHLEIKELKKPEELALITQPLIASPLDYYSYYYPYSGYSIPTLPKASLISPISTLPAIPYPYALIRTI